MFSCTNCDRQSDMEGHLPHKAVKAIGRERSEKVCVHCQNEFEEAVSLFPGDFIVEEDDEESFH